MKIFRKIIFMLGIIISIIIGLLIPSGFKVYGIPFGLSIIIMIGFVIGLFYIKNTRTNKFMFMTIFLLMLGNAGLFVSKNAVVFHSVLISILAFLAPVAILIGGKALIEMSK